MFTQRDFLAQALKTPQFTISGSPAPASADAGSGILPTGSAGGNGLGTAASSLVQNTANKALGDPLGKAGDWIVDQLGFGSGLPAAATTPGMAPTLAGVYDAEGLALGGFSPGGFAATAGPLMMGAIAAPIAMDMIGRVLQDNTKPTPWMQPYSDPASKTNAVSMFPGANLEGLTVGDLNALAAIAAPRAVWGPDSPEAKADIPVAPNLQSFVGRDVIPAADHAAMLADALRRGIDMVGEYRRNWNPTAAAGH